MNDFHNLSGMNDAVSKLSGTLASKQMGTSDTITNVSFRLQSGNIPGLSQEIGGHSLNKSVSGRSF